MSPLLTSSRLTFPNSVRGSASVYASRSGGLQHEAARRHLIVELQRQRGRDARRKRVRRAAGDRDRDREHDALPAVRHRREHELARPWSGGGECPREPTRRLPQLAGRERVLAGDPGTIRVPARPVPDDLRQRQALPVAASPVCVLNPRGEQRVHFQTRSHFRNDDPTSTSSTSAAVAACRAARTSRTSPARR